MTYLADHSLLLALPALAPAALIVGVVTFVVWRDRRRAPDDDATVENEDIPT